MATEKKFLSEAGLTHYDERIKEYIATKDAEVKSYADSLGTNYDPAGTAQTKVDALANGAVKTNTEAIAKLNGADTVVGSVDNKIKTVTEKLKEEISASAYDDTAIKGRISANEAAIAVLNGSGAGSVDKKVADAVAAIVSDAPEAYDTLKEISDWISSHSSSASAMNSKITANETEISKLKTLLGTLPEGTAAKTIVEYISSVVSTAKSEAVSTAASDAATKANKALADAKAYADGLGKNYATAAQGAKADSAVQAADVTTGTTNGTISVKGAAVPVKGLGSAAYVATSAFDAAGTAQTKVDSLANGTVKTNTSKIATLEGKVAELSFTEITEADIDALFK